MGKHLKLPQDIIIQSWLTERTNTLQEEEGRYAFKVDQRANKHQIRDAVEKMFKVHVVSVNVMRVHGKTRRVRYKEGSTASWKKAMVKLKTGETIEI
jgi:large subunit ribosomal protein L23